MTVLSVAETTASVTVDVLSADVMSLSSDVPSPHEHKRHIASMIGIIDFFIVTVPFVK